MFEGNTDHFPVEFQFLGACYKGDLTAVKRLFDQASVEFHITGIEYACLFRKREVVEELLNRVHASLSNLIPIAYLGGDLEVVELLKARGLHQDEERCLMYAYMNGSDNVVRHADAYFDVSPVIGEPVKQKWNNALAGACWGGHIGLVEKCCLKGATDFRGGYGFALKGCHSDVALMMQEKGGF